MVLLSIPLMWKAGHYEEDDLFTGVLYNYYSPPPSFCWELLCNDEPIMDNPNLHDYNLDRRARDFVEYAKNANKAYRTNHVAITTGMDFHYQVKFMFSKKATKNYKIFTVALTQTRNIKEKQMGLKP